MLRAMIVKQVDAQYRHRTKLVHARQRMDLRGSVLKWYEIADIGATVTNQVRQTALAFLHAQSATANWPLDQDVGFVVLHRCEGNFFFLILCTWRGNNELWETVYAKPNDAAPDFAFCPWAQHKAAFCVWEFGVVAHEVQAWTHYLNSARTRADLDTYLACTFEGAVG